jgi:tetratricopeptide (TPR) repeat protein
VRVFREAKQFDDMDRAWAEMCEQTPADPRAYVYGIVQQAVAGREVSASAALEDYLFHFAGAPRNLQLVAEPLAEIADLPLLERCAAAAGELHYAAQPFQLLLVQARVKRGEWEAAARTLRAMKPAVGRTAAQEQLWRDWMGRLLDSLVGPSESASLSLVDFLRSRPWPVQVFQTTVEALRRAKQAETARAVLGLVRAMFPASCWAENQEIEVAQEIAGHPPAPAGLIAVRGSLAPQNVYFQQLDEALRGEHWDTAGQLIRAARNAQPEPGWLSSRDGDLRLAEMRVADAQGERPRMLAAAALYLNGDSERSQQVLDFGRACFARGDRDSAIALLNEVLRRSPNVEPARKLVSEWRNRTQ